LLLILQAVPFKVGQQLLIGSILLLTARALALSVPGAARDMLTAQLGQRSEFLLNLLEFGLSLLVDLARLLLKRLLDLLLQAAHIISVILLDHLLQLGFLPLQLRLTDEILAHFAVFCLLKD
jgi:hypothetical protein